MITQACLPCMSDLANNMGRRKSRVHEAVVRPWVVQRFHGDACQRLGPCGPFPSSYGRYWVTVCCMGLEDGRWQLPTFLWHRTYVPV